jgi:hypothetical protein
MQIKEAHNLEMWSPSAFLMMMVATSPIMHNARARSSTALSLEVPASMASTSVAEVLVGPHMSRDLRPCLGPRQLGQLRSSVPDRLDSCGCGGFGREEAEKRLRQSSSRLSYRGSYREEEIFLGGECERVVGDGDFSGA